MFNQTALNISALTVLSCPDVRAGCVCVFSFIFLFYFVSLCCPTPGQRPSSSPSTSAEPAHLLDYGLYYHTYINSHLFPMGVGRNYRTPPATILTYSSRVVHIHTSDHTRTSFASTTHLSFLKNLNNKTMYVLQGRPLPA